VLTYTIVVIDCGGFCFGEISHDLMKQSLGRI